MKFFKYLFRTIIFLADLVFLAFAVGTVWYGIPYLGSIAGYMTVPVWNYCVAVLLAVAVFHFIVLCAKRRKKGFWRLTLLMCAVTVCLHAYAYNTAVTELRSQGADISVFTGFGADRDVSGVKVDEYVYTKGEKGELSLDVYSAGDAGEEKKPVFVYIHGGGWAAGSRKGHSYYSSVFAKNGFVAVNIDYDLSNAEEHYWDKTEDELCRALAWISENAEKLGADTDRIFLTGDSAGGHLALELGSKINGGVYTEAEGTELPKIRALSVSYPVSSPADFYLNADELLGRYTRPMVEYYTGTDPVSSPELINLIEPINYIGKETPPTLIYVGEADSTVPPAFTYRYAGELEKEGVDVSLVRVPFANHAFDNNDGSFASEAYIDLTMKWFKDHGAFA